jgi:hypothetical protein
MAPIELIKGTNLEKKKTPPIFSTKLPVLAAEIGKPRRPVNLAKLGLFPGEIKAQVSVSSKQAVDQPVGGHVLKLSQIRGQYRLQIFKNLKIMPNHHSTLPFAH